VSFSWVSVGSAEASFFYAPGSPCREARGTRLAIPLL
jgi:hypothetical protein